MQCDWTSWKLGWRRRKDGVDLSCFGPGGFQGGGVRGLMNIGGVVRVSDVNCLSSELNLGDLGYLDARRIKIRIQLE